MKNINKIVFTFFMLLMVVIVPVHAQAKEENLVLKVHAKYTVQSTKKSKVTVYWSKVDNATGFDIYRAKLSKKSNGTYKVSSSWKKVASVAGNKNSYSQTVAYGSGYKYLVMMYSGKSKKSKYCSQSDSVEVGNTSIGEMYLDKYTNEEGVSLSYYYRPSEKVKAKGYEIYRKTNNGKYKKIATTKKREYKDKKAIDGQVYYYKVRAYGKKNGKKIYSQFSDPIKAKVYESGRYTTQFSTRTGNVDSFVCKITSNPYNEQTKIFRESEVSLHITTDKEGGQYDILEDNLFVQKYSYDAINWIDFASSNEIVLAPGKTIHIQFALRDRDQKMTVDMTKIEGIFIYNVMYGGQEATFDIDIEDNKIKTSCYIYE